MRQHEQGMSEGMKINRRFRRLTPILISLSVFLPIRVSSIRGYVHRRNLLLLPLLFLMACGNNAAAPTLAPTAEIAPSAAAVQPTSTLPATNTPAAFIPTEPAATALADPTAAPAEIAPDATASLPTAEPPVAFNGKNEDGTFFRGRADAPVTLIDYSDFL